MLVVDNTVLNLAMPALVRNPSAAPADVKWMIGAYILVGLRRWATVPAGSDQKAVRRSTTAGAACSRGPTWPVPGRMTRGSWSTTSSTSATWSAGDRVAQIEQHWAQLLGPDRFADTCHALQELLDELGAG